MADLFDWGPHKGGSGEFVKFENTGDKVVGTIVAIRLHTFDEKKGPVPLIDLDTGAEDTLTLAVDKVDLRRQIGELEPQVGDKLGVEYVQNERTPSGTKKVFKIQHRAAERKAPEPDLDGYSDEPF